MSLAVLARKTRTKQINRKKSSTCPNDLNMSGRGGGIGLSRFGGKTSTYNNCQQNKCGSNQSSCCDTTVAPPCNNVTSAPCFLKRPSRPTPQLSYRNYINRKAAGSFRPGGKICCDRPDCTRKPLSGCDYTGISCDDKNGKCISACKNQNTVKHPPSLSCGDVTAHRRQATVRLGNALVVYNCSGGACKSNTAFKAKQACQQINKNKNECPCFMSLKVKPRLSYTRINHNDCTITKPVSMGTTAGEQMEKIKVSVYKCSCDIVDNDPSLDGYKIRKVCDCEKLPEEKRMRCKKLLTRYCFPRGKHSVERNSAGAPNRNTCLIDGSIATTPADGY